LANKRIFDIAKELGVDSKAVVAKCHAEGISTDVVKTHMSPVSKGLELSIREWFSGVSGGAAGGATAVEEGEKIKVDESAKPKAARRPARKAADGSGGESGGGTATAVETAPAKASSAGADGDQPTGATPSSPTAQAAPAHTHGSTHSGSQSGSTHSAGHTTHATHTSHGHSQPQSPVLPDHAKATPIQPSRIEQSTPAPVARRPEPTTAGTSHPAGHASSSHGSGTAERTSDRAAGSGSDRASGAGLNAGSETGGTRTSDAPKPPPIRLEPKVIAAPTAPIVGADEQAHAAGATDSTPHAKAQGSGTGSGSGHGPASGHAPGHGGEGTAGAGSKSAAPSRIPPGFKPTMNVPTRPTVVSPAGPKLEIRTPVKLAGPKVVRIEAAEVVDAPRPRRTGPGGPGGPSGPGRSGPGRPGETAGDDDGRGKKRFSGGSGGGGGGAPAGPGQKRSSGQGVPQRRRATASQAWVGAAGQGISEQDLIEREERLQRSGGFLKKRRQDAKKPGQPATAGGPAEGVVRIAAPFTIKDLSAATGVKAADIVKKLFLQGVMATINSGIDVMKAQEIMIDFDIELEVTEAKSAEEKVTASFENRDSKDLRPRGPVVTILGHVDHGKTSLLDKIRNAKVAAGEAGGITQRTSAFRVPLTLEGIDKEVVFLDTPGHEAFTSMRSRGANMTDVIVLVVSAPEGVMPQTVESINHAKAAKVPIVVALNKVDRPDATDQQIRKVLGQLAEAGLNVTEWGGDVEMVRTSATTGLGIPQLLETLDLQSQVLELKADFSGPAQGTVIESKMEEGRGAVANILVQQGKLKVGDFVVMGRGFGRVRDITDDRGTRQKEATPPMPVQISGIDEVPDAGDKFYVVDSLKKAMEAAEQRRIRERQAQLAQPRVTLDSLFTQMAERDLKEILVVLKAAEQGTVDVLKSQCEKVGTSEVKIRVLHAAIGGITESDVILAEASKAIIIGFNVIPSGKARTQAEVRGVEIRTYEVIYNIVDDLKKAAEGLLAPEVRQEILGHAEVRKVFKVTKVGTIAGCYVTDGTIERNALIRVTRNGIVVENGRVLEQLKRFKDDAKEVRTGMECGMKIVGYDDIKEGDILECYKQVEVKRTL
jgi:translation initiation factor IF-2